MMKAHVKNCYDIRIGNCYFSRISCITRYLSDAVLLCVHCRYMIAWQLGHIDPILPRIR